MPCLPALFLIFTLFFTPFVHAAQAGQAGKPGQPAGKQDAAAGAYKALPRETPRPLQIPSGQGPSLGVNTTEAQPLYMPGQTAGYKNQLGMPAWQQQQLYAPRYELYPPFGATLFQGRFAGTYHEGINPHYIIMPGDRILVQVWGARAYNDVLMVDPQGNIFLPEVGPLTVAGLNQGALQGAIKSHIASVFLSNVEIYVSLLTAQPVGVYVTGFVPAPGRYAGGPGDSPLYYLDKAGGIIPERGSYRDITVLRGNRLLARIDLYPFLLNGSLPSVRLQDGDVIAVGPRKSSVIATGLIPQYASYESSGASMKGAELLRFAAPQPQVSHAGVTGARKTVPFHQYLSLDKLAEFTLENGDMVEFLADTPGDVTLISVSGAIKGVSRYPVRRDATLRQLLAHVPVDEKLVNLEGIYIKRRSVAEQQRKAIRDSLFRLENSVLTASSATAEIAAIRAQEAQLVQNFAQRVSQLEPDGVVVVSRNKKVADILLEDGDEVVIPQRSDVVQITGEVIVPKSVVYDAKMGLSDYVAAAGGFTERADRSYILVVHPNGEIIRASRGEIRAGDMLMVMPYYDSKSFQLVKDIMGVLYQIAVATKVVLTL
jgi:protein involved in polysaccharide export with SLBB domain